MGMFTRCFVMFRCLVQLPFETSAELFVVQCLSTVVDQIFYVMGPVLFRKTRDRMTLSKSGGA